MGLRPHRRAGRGPRALSILAVLLLGLLAAPAAALGATITWDGGGITNDWSEAANWSGDAVPGYGDAAVIEAGASVTVDAEMAVSDLQVGPGSSVELQAGVTFGSPLDVQGAGELIVADGVHLPSLVTLRIRSGVTYHQLGAIVLAGVLDLTGTGVLEPGAVIEAGTGSPQVAVSGAGELHLGDGAIVNVPLEMHGGQVMLEEGSSATLGRGGHFEDHAELDVPAASTLSIAGQHEYAVSEALTMEGAGTVELGTETTLSLADADVHLGGGTLRVPNGATTAKITGDGAFHDGRVELCAPTPVADAQLTFAADVEVAACAGISTLYDARLSIHGALRLTAGVTLSGPAETLLTIADDAELSVDGNVQIGVQTRIEPTATVRITTSSSLAMWSEHLPVNLVDGDLVGGRWRIEPHATLQLNGAEGLISGIKAGTLVLAQAGNVTVDGATHSALADTITLHEGAVLQLDDVTLGRSVTITEGARLTAAGVIEGDVVMHGGTFAPGVGGRRLEVYGNITLAGGVLDVNVDPEAADPPLSMRTSEGAFSLSVAPPAMLRMRMDVAIPEDLEDVTLVEATDVVAAPAFASQEVLLDPPGDGEWSLRAAFVGTDLLANRLDVKAPEPPTVLTSPTHGADPVTDRRIEIDFDGASDTGIGLAGYVVRWGAAAPEQPGDGTITHPHDVDADAGQSWELPDLGTGLWYVAVWAVDAHGNVSAEPAIAGPFAIDVTPPPVPSVGNAPGVTTARTAALVFSSAESGVRYECSLNGAAFAACTSPATLSGLGLGSHAFRVRAIDALGNVSAPGSIGWTVVAPPPPPPPPPPPTTTPPPPPPPVTPPKLPAKKAITLTGQSRLSQAKRRGQLWLRFPVTAKGVRSRVQITVSARDARRLGIKVPRRAKTVTIGTVTVTSKRRGNVTAKVKFTKAARTAFKRTTLRSVKVTVRLTLSKSGASRATSKAFTLRR